MTTDEFERILMALANMRAWNINGEHLVPLEGVIRVIHSNLHSDDRSLYDFDFRNNRWTKKETGDRNEPKAGRQGSP